MARVHPDKAINRVEEEDDPMKAAKGNIYLLIYSLLLPRFRGIFNDEYSVNFDLDWNNFC